MNELLKLKASNLSKESNERLKRYLKNKASVRQAKAI